MYNSELEAIKDRILEYNTYFDQGYSDVYQDPVKGIVHNDLPVFPSDSLGNYFYLRLPDSVRFTPSADSRINDCDTPLNMNAVVLLVACVKDADPDRLMSNLLITLQKTDNVTVTAGVFDSARVVLNELARVSEATQKTALARLDDITIVSLSFSLDKIFQPQKLSCITNPCREC